MSRLPPVCAITLALGLAGCVSLFPKADPVQLYRFDGPGAAPGVSTPTLSVLRGPTGFTRSAASDRILTVDGAAVAYIKDARWETPAAILFDEALAQAFDASPQIRLATRGEPAGTDAVLRADVRAFEARYLQGLDAPPTAVVEVRATLTTPNDRGVVSSRLFRAEQLASENRVGPIVAAYDAAVDKVLDELVRWTAESASRVAARPNPPAIASPR